MKTFLFSFIYISLSILLILGCSGPEQNNLGQTKTDTLQASTPGNTTTPVQENSGDFSKSYQGEIAGKYPIRMQLTRTGNELTGRYAYTKVGKDIPLAGSVDSEGKFSIQETDEQGKVTGVFEGRFDAATTLSGNWRSPDTGKVLSFSLQESNHNTTSKSVSIGQGMELAENSFTLEGKNGIDGEYAFPTITGESTAASTMNEVLAPKNLMGETIEEMKATFKDCSCGTLGVSYHVNYNANNILDMSIFIETLGAYSSGYVKRFTFNTTTGEKLSIGQLLKPTALSQLAAECDALLQERVKKAMGEAEEGEGAEWLKELMQDKKFEVEHLENFSISSEGITFYYPYGFPHAAIALEPDDAFLYSFLQLKDDIEPTSLLGPLVQK
ncbi:hypothetical protein GXP67_10990 [Rhodocytophaga rosea]|uniref:DUF3298 domain-containing protein n=1 Tax=Rhodocytophaga rosea TaxID=2704465 RepID=A0A6C0GH40_9BACT|nr:hypothetical protein [Rhodocytophaga rosea]QHT67134.1 hypothetical protein GXP67_10990 [Rhodocytophaga rosea]